jgi:hypothetical protein
LPSAQLCSKGHRSSLAPKNLRALSLPTTAEEPPIVVNFVNFGDFAEGPVHVAVPDCRDCPATWMTMDIATPREIEAENALNSSEWSNKCSNSERESGPKSYRTWSLSTPAFPWRNGRTNLLFKFTAHFGWAMEMEQFG